MLPDRIVLCGFMGAGKTRVGTAVAESLGYRFVDLDDEIEQHEGRAIAAIFADSGEAYFRRVETTIGCKLMMDDKIVVALGGGAVTSSELMAAVRTHGCLIYLRATPDILWERIKGSDERPLIAEAKSLEDFMAIHEERMKVRRPIYETADITIETTDAPVEDTAARVLASLQEKA